MSVGWWWRDLVVLLLTNADFFVRQDLLETGRIINTCLSENGKQSTVQVNAYQWRHDDVTARGNMPEPACRVHSEYHMSSVNVESGTDVASRAQKHRSCCTQRLNCIRVTVTGTDKSIRYSMTDIPVTYVAERNRCCIEGAKTPQLLHSAPQLH
jgi:hypothetical protein